ncbi:MAG: hypothetical protein ABI920_09360 [Casimicrobiaceae bacterium]
MAAGAPTRRHAAAAVADARIARDRGPRARVAKGEQPGTSPARGRLGASQGDDPDQQYDRDGHRESVQACTGVVCPPPDDAKLDSLVLRSMKVCRIAAWRVATMVTQVETAT